MTDALLPSRVLFVDDDRSMRVAFGNAARALGIEAVVAETGGEACGLASQEPFAVVVTDLRMPGIDGVALIERLSSLDPTTAFVVVSAGPEQLPGFRRLADGAIASLLTKPMEVNAFRQALAAAYALHNRRRLRAAAATSPEAWSLLVVEDSPGDSLLLEEHLSDVPGLSIAHASCLQDALTLLHDRPFDAILTDLTLPDARGFDAVLRLQASAPEAALLAYSELEDEELVLQVVQLGAQDFLQKSGTNRISLLRALRVARERKRAELRLRRLAHYDQLTGLANRASFDGVLTQALARAERQEQRLAVMMIDLDGFKEVNDSLGHAAGDQVLQDVGVRLRCLFRDYDVVARFGGDEFAVLLTDVVSLAHLSEIATRVLGAIVHPSGPPGHRVTGSVGIALWPDHGRTARQLLRAADKAMYTSKHAGRNRFTYFEGMAPLSSHPVAPESAHDEESSTRLLLPRLSAPPEFIDDLRWLDEPRTRSRRA